MCRSPVTAQLTISGRYEAPSGAPPPVSVMMPLIGATRRKNGTAPQTGCDRFRPSVVVRSQFSSTAERDHTHHSHGVEHTCARLSRRRCCRLRLSDQLGACHLPSSDRGSPAATLRPRRCHRQRSPRIEVCVEDIPLSDPVVDSMKPPTAHPSRTVRSHARSFVF